MLIPARIGYTRAFAMFALGEGMTGAQAAQLGVANIALPAGEVIAAAREAARKLAQRPPGAVMATKKLMRDSETILTQLRTEGKVFGERLSTAEAMEAFMAFQQKRAPDFSKF
jgi:1,4-dihydroxy-2-naphthoyl-CoA synthase